MLDAGPQNFNQPSHILITHTHIDHCACLPLTLIGDPNGNTPNVYCVQEAGPRILKYISGMFSLNAMEDCDAEPFYNFHGLKSGMTFSLTTKNTDLQVEVFACDHPIPTISYGFAERKEKSNRNTWVWRAEKLASCERREWRSRKKSTSSVLRTFAVSQFSP